MIGSLIGHYQIEAKIGEGGMGVVYKAEDTRLLRSVAIKILPQHLVVDEKNRQRFIHEARAASALNHSKIWKQLAAIRSNSGKTLVSKSSV